MMGQPAGDPALLPGLLLLLQCVNQFDGRQEPDPLTVVLDRLHDQSDRQMSLAGTWATNEHCVLAVFQKLAAVQRFHQSPTHKTLTEVKAGRPGTWPLSSGS